MNIYQFIDRTKGLKLALPNGNQKGQCVSLVQQYLIQVFNIPFKARGHAKDFGTSLVKEKLACEVFSPSCGDIIVYSGTKANSGYGHIAIYIDKNKMYDQNNETHDNYKAGYSKILSGAKKYYRILTKTTEWTKGDYELLESKAVRKTHELTNNIQLVGKMKSARPYCTSINPLAKAHIKKGTICKIDKIYYGIEGCVWGAFGQYWLVLCDLKGIPQARKVS